MLPPLPGATLHEVALLDDVEAGLARVAATLSDTSAALRAALAASPWRGRGAEAAGERGAAVATRLDVALSAAGTARVLVVALRGRVATEAAALVAVESACRSVLGRLLTLPWHLAEPLLRAGRQQGWAAVGIGALPLPPGGAAAWRDVSRVLGDLLP